MGKKKKKLKEMKKRRLDEVNVQKKKKQDEIEILKEQVKRLEITIKFMERDFRKIKLKQLETCLNNGEIAIACKNIQGEMDVFRKVLYEKEIISVSDFAGEGNHTKNP